MSQLSAEIMERHLRVRKAVSRFFAVFAAAKVNREGKMTKINEITLDQLRVGEAGVIRLHTGASHIQGRLKELGLVRGTKVVLERCAPLGDPLEIRVRGYHLAIRKQDAACITVAREESPQ